MKKLLFLSFLLLGYSSGFAQDTNLGEIALTDKQLSQSENLKSDVIKGFASGKDGLVVVSTRPLTAQETSDLVSNLAVLPDEYTKEILVAKFDVKKFFGRIIEELTPERWLELSKLGVGWTMQQLGEYPNFLGLKYYIEALATDGTLTEEDVKTINLVLLEQGIDLSSFRIST